ncbi:MAG: hypothetical protein JRN15_09705 [Nitrososphaerota archaeon]|nr:hypothetical protein [Nitrososphaerota archaeon]
MSYTRNDLIGKKVYGPDASFLGEICDLGLTIGVIEPSLIIKGESSNFELPWENVAFVKDIVLTKQAVVPSSLKQIQVGEAPKQQPVTQPQKSGSIDTSKFCTSCGKHLKWIKEYNRFYCYNCKKYA